MILKTQLHMPDDICNMPNIILFPWNKISFKYNFIIEMSRWYSRTTNTLWGQCDSLVSCTFQKNGKWKIKEQNSICIVLILSINRSGRTISRKQHPELWIDMSRATRSIVGHSFNDPIWRYALCTLWCWTHKYLTIHVVLFFTSSAWSVGCGIVGLWGGLRWNLLSLLRSRIFHIHVLPILLVQFDDVW